MSGRRSARRQDDDGGGGGGGDEGDDLEEQRPLTGRSRRAVTTTMGIHCTATNAMLGVAVFLLVAITALLAASLATTAPLIRQVKDDYDALHAHVQRIGHVLTRVEQVAPGVLDALEASAPALRTAAPAIATIAEPLAAAVSATSASTHGSAAPSIAEILRNLIFPPRPPDTSVALPSPPSPSADHP